MAHSIELRSEARKALAQYLKSRREALDMTQNQLAKILGYSSAQIVSNWERGVIAVPFVMVKKLVRILDLDCNVVADCYVKYTEVLIQKTFRKNLKIQSVQRRLR